MMLPDGFQRFGGDEIRRVNYDQAGVVVLPLCYEQAVSYGTGCREGPRWLLEASSQLELLDEETLTEWDSAGIHTLPPLSPGPDPRQAVETMRRAALEVLREGKFLLSLGGDHAVSIGPAAAAAERYPGVGVLQVDAHMDLRDRWNGSRFNHACVMRRLVEDHGLAAVQVGIRSFSAEEARFARQNSALRTVFAHQIDPLDPSWIPRAVAALPPLVYLTVDLDGLDPAALPGTGTPEPGGLSYRQLVALLAAVGRERTVVAADITELAKIPGQQVSEYTAARIAAKIFVHCGPV
jgi:agmatinase